MIELEPKQRPTDAAGLLQRKCGCGSHAQGQCPACKKKRRLQRRSRTTESSGTAPPIVHEVLRSPGQPLDAATRAFMEPRFGHDFSNVRIHTDPRANESAASVNAQAYTVGNNIVFGRGQYSPSSVTGRKLLAHELTHTVQQSDETTLSTRSLDIGASETPAEREADCVAEKVTSNTIGDYSLTLRASPMVQRVCGAKLIGSVGGCIGQGGQDITDVGYSGEQLFRFKAGCDEFLPGEEARLRAYAATIGRDETVEIHGFASEEGEFDFNENLSCARADRAADILGEEDLGVTITLIKHGPVAGYRPDRRSVVIDVKSEASSKTESQPEFLCGPDVTEEIKRALRDAGAAFDALNSSDQADACSALVFALEGALTSWDIVELHNRAWIRGIYRPQGCATFGADPPCGHTVQVGDQCYFGGSANYVVYGFMMRKCYDVYGGNYPAVKHMYTKEVMLEKIEDYKGPGLISDASNNYRESRAWASAGYDGWPSGGSPPPGDRNNCVPACPIPFRGPRFHVRWCPEIDPYNQCGKYLRVAKVPIVE